MKRSICLDHQCLNSSSEQFHEQPLEQLQTTYEDRSYVAKLYEIYFRYIQSRLRLNEGIEGRC